MPLFQIVRNVPGETVEGMDAAVFRAIVCAVEFNDLVWVRSFWDQPTGVITCYYEAPDEQTIREHASRSRIPCDRVTEVRELVPEAYEALAPSG